MQDIALLISDPARIGITEFDRAISFSTVKNNLQTGIELQKRDLFTETIIECEHDIYNRSFLILKHCGVNFSPVNIKVSTNKAKLAKTISLSEITIENRPKIFVHPSFGVFLTDIRKKLKNVTISSTHDIACVLKGDIKLENCTFGSTSLWIENNSFSCLKVHCAIFQLKKFRM